MPAKRKSTRKTASSEKQANLKAGASELPAPGNSASHGFFSTEKWRRDFEEYVNRSSKEHEERRKATREINRQLIAKMQAMEEMGEIYRQVDKRLKDGEWDKCRGLPREQQRERYYHKSTLKNSWSECSKTSLIKRQQIGKSIAFGESS
jgi:hypothetical protein